MHASESLSQNLRKPSPGVVLLTGAGGYIAGVLAKELQSTGWEVRGLDLKAGERAGVRIVAADITRPLDPVLFAGVYAIVHLAGKVHALAEVAADESAYFLINTEGTRHVLEAAQIAGVRRMVFLSTVKAMGEGNSPEQALAPLNENSPCAPLEPYGASKLAAEKLVLEGGYLPEPVVLRLSMVYGGAEAKGNLPKMMEAVRKNRFPPIPEVGNRRSMVHVDDVTSAIRLAVEHPQAGGQLFLVTDGDAYSTRQILNWMREACGMSPVRSTVPLWVLRLLGMVGDLIGKVRGRRFVFDSDALHKLIGSAWYSSEKIQNALGFKPKHGLRETLMAEGKR